MDRVDSAGFWSSAPVLDNLTARWALSIVKKKNPTLSPPIVINAPLIISAFFILILSAAFRHGVELEIENSLTV